MYGTSLPYSMCDPCLISATDQRRPASKLHASPLIAARSGSTSHLQREEQNVINTELRACISPSVGDGVGVRYVRKVVMVGGWGKACLAPPTVFVQWWKAAQHL